MPTNSCQVGDCVLKRAQTEVAAPACFKQHASGSDAWDTECLGDSPGIFIVNQQ
ncbi:hypothetical protein SBA4_4820011 [Candidatus Sulfopaludibacter sp. SbA4]|nr:hypothetical protein SBA4_4820011 [Candidatus Sulfopaludibacter sp. SbA4]